MRRRWRLGTIALLLSPLGIVVVSATRLLLIANYNPTTATAIASSGGYVNTLLGSVIPLVPVALPYLALVLVGFKRYFLAGLTAAAALIVSPARVTFPKLAFSNSNNAVKADLHKFAGVHPTQTLWTGAILLVAALLAAWQWDRDVREDVIDDVNRIKGLPWPVRRRAPQYPGSATRNPNPEIAEVARKYRVTPLAVQQWANRGIWFRHRTLVFLVILWIASLLYVPYIYPFPRSITYYEAMLHQPWLPAERITLSSGGDVVGYPLTIDGGWMVVLVDRTRSIQYISTKDVMARTVCQTGQQAILVAATSPVTR